MPEAGGDEGGGGGGGGGGGEDITLSTLSTQPVPGLNMCDETFPANSLDFSAWSKFFTPFPVFAIPILGESTNIHIIINDY